MVLQGLQDLQDLKDSKEFEERQENRDLLDPQDLLVNADRQDLSAKMYVIRSYTMN